MKKSGKLACHVVNSDIAIISLPTLQISLGLVALFEKIYMYDKEPILTVFSNIGEDAIPSFQFSVRCEKCVAARQSTVIGKQLLISNDRNWVR